MQVCYATITTLYRVAARIRRTLAKAGAVGRVGREMTRKLLDRTADLLAVIAGAILILMMLHITAHVACRYLFAWPFQDTVEIVSTYYIVAIVFLPLALVERLNGHIVVELFSQHLPRRTLELLIGCIGLASAGYFGAFTWRTGQDALQTYAAGEMMLGTAPITVWPTRF